MSRVLYSYGLPFSECFKNVLDKLIERVNNKKPVVIINSGGLGEGKTTFGLHQADYINKTKGFPPVDLSQGKECPQYALGGKDFVKKLRVCYEQNLPVIIYDEAGDFAKRGALTSFNSMINRIFETFRTFNIIVILTLPDFDCLDSSLFDKHIPRILCRLKDRSNTQGNFEVYSLYRMLLLKSRMKTLKMRNYAYSVIHPNLRGHFLDLEKERSILLDQISTTNKFEMLKDADDKIEGLMSNKQISDKFGIPLNTLRKRIQENQVKPTKKVGTLNFYDKKTINTLLEDKRKK